MNGGIKPVPVPFISADNLSSHNYSTSSIKKVHHHQLNGGIPASNVHATTLTSSRPTSRAGSRTRSRSRSKSQPRSQSRSRAGRHHNNTTSSSHISTSSNNGRIPPPLSIFPQPLAVVSRPHQSSISGQSHFSHTGSTGRLITAHSAPINQRFSRY